MRPVIRRSNLSTSLYLLLIFISGALVGAFGDHLYAVKSVMAGRSRGPEEYKRRYIDEMRTRLKLNADQVNQLSSIMDETRHRFHEQHERAKPELDQIQNEQVAKVRALLTDLQRGEYEKMRIERERRRSLEHKHD